MTLERSVHLGDREIGANAPCYVIAEAGVNHNGDLGIAKRLVEAAAAAGADAVKFQLFTADEVASANAPKAPYQVAAIGAEISQHAMLASLELSRESVRELKSAADAVGIDFLCTCYSEDELDFLAELPVPAFKFASAQIVELPFLAYAGRKAVPVLLSTGMATLDEIEVALQSLDGSDVVLLQCTTSYPANVSEANLLAIPAMAEHFGLLVGYSDHTPGDTASIAAVACGAVLLEKHLTLDKGMAGPDHRASLNPEEFAALVGRVREAESALGSPLKQPTAGELENAPIMRRSLFAAVDIPAGTTITREMILLNRPYVGLAPGYLPKIIGATARVDIAAATPLSLDLIDG